MHYVASGESVVAGAVGPRQCGISGNHGYQGV